MSADNKVVLPKKAKGARPYFFEDANQDKLLAMLMGLVGEVSVLADRVDTMERLLEEKGVLTREQINSYTPDATVNADRDARRDVLLAQVLRVLTQDDTNTQKDTDEQYRAVVEMVEA
jgi:hypothetical protein